MVEIDWRFVLAFLVVQGGIIVAAAKSIFVTKSKIYDNKGITIFVPREELKTPREEFKDLCKERRENFEGALQTLNKVASTVVSRSEWEGSYKEREKRHSEDQKRLCKKLDDLQDGQRNIEQGLAKLYGLLEKDGGI